MNYFAIDYTIHFDDTMAYGSHHFLTAFKFQCAARESFLFGQLIYDPPGVKEALDGVHLLTSDAYSRNLNPARLGERVAILLTLEEWGKASARFCYRVIGEQRQPIAAGFQTLVCANAKTGAPCLIPPPLWDAMNNVRSIEEPRQAESFRDRVLAGGTATDSLFGEAERNAATQILNDRYPSPQVIQSSTPVAQPQLETPAPAEQPVEEDAWVEAWVFSGQGAFDAGLLVERVEAYRRLSLRADEEFEACATAVKERLGLDARPLFSGSPDACAKAVQDMPDLSQVAIFTQSYLGAFVRKTQGHQPSVLMGHSFGEIAALAVAECFDLTTGVCVVCERVRAIAEHAPPGGGLLAVSLERASVSSEVSLLGANELVVAGRNHQRQTIVSGPIAELERLKDRLRGLGVNSVSVPSPTSFHHPRLRAAAQAWGRELRKLEIIGPNLTVFSPIGRRFVDADDDIATTLASQLLAPFDLQGAVADVIESGVTRFVDCGSTGALARLLAAAGPEETEVVPAHARPFEPPLAPARKDSIAQRHPELAPEPAKCDDAACQEQSPANQREESIVLPPVAIVGQGCLLPGGARSPEMLFDVISQQRSGLVDLSDIDPHWSEDFYSEELTPDRSTTRLMGRVNDSDIVAPEGVDPQVFAGFSRTQRLLCAALAPCVESLRGAERVMCLIGASADGFEDHDTVVSLRSAGIDPADGDIDQILDTARSADSTPHAAVQEVFDRLIRPGLKVVLIDAACASSLYAAAIGMRALEANETDAVVAGGVFCPGPGNSCLFSQFLGTTATGLRPFDATADGTVFSEGSAVVTLRRAEDAERQGLPMIAVLRGAGLSSDGRSSSANFPQTRGQILSLERCYESYGLDPATVNGVEAHGTSTPVGDATEIETLRQFYEDHTEQPLPVHSLKGLLGHGGWTAGTASLIAAGEYLRRGEFPAQAYYTKPSDAIVRAEKTLRIPEQTESLPAGKRRLAVDGFGFGGANAHLVLERAGDGEPLAPITVPKHDDQLVVVACSEVEPTLPTEGGMRFNRDSVAPPSGHLILPDLQQDMDISQTLTMLLVDELVSQLPDFETEWRRQTGLVLALRGKTERGVEATMRVLASRFGRELTGLPEPTEKLKEAMERSRPSGPYTLQCMMPNVSAGRAALYYNLNGPNLVVDGAEHSLEDAMESAALLLRGGEASGVKAVLVAAIEANLRQPSAAGEAAPRDEFATAFAVTTRDQAERAGLPILFEVQTLLEDSSGNSANSTMGQKVRALTTTLATPSGAKEEKADATLKIECPIHEPVWVEAPLPAQALARPVSRGIKLLAIAPDNADLVAEMMRVAPQASSSHLVMVVGKHAQHVVQNHGGPNLVALDLANPNQALASAASFAPDCVAVVDAIESWDLRDALKRVDQSPLGDAMFLVAKQLVDQLEHGVDLWGLYLDAWNGKVHAASGAVAGLLKSIQRETPQARARIFCTRGLSLAEAFERALQERSSETDDQEVVYDRGMRLARRLRRPLLEQSPDPANQLSADSVVIATGGGRGVTALMVEALVKDYAPTVIVLGRSEPEACPWALDDPDLLKNYYESYLKDSPGATAAEMKREYEKALARWETHDNLRQLSTLGGTVAYQAVDITHPEQVAAAVRQIAKEFGRVDLLVHGAGVQTSKRLRDRSLSDFRRTYAVKVSGLRNLVQACHDEFGQIVRAHVLTSAYSVFGNDGQHDYGAANETLDRLCLLSSDNPAARWTSIAWLAWDGIGMTRGSEYQALAQNRGLLGVTPEVGQHLFRQVITGESPARINVPLSDSEHTRYGIKTVPPVREGETGKALEVSVELATIDCLSHHKVRSTPTLPGAWTLERMVAAALQRRPEQRDAAWAVVRDARFYRFVRLSGGHEPNLRIIAAPTNHGVKLWMVGDVLHATGTILSKDVVYAEARVELSRQSLAPRASLKSLDLCPTGACDCPTGSCDDTWRDPYCDGQRTNLLDLTGPFDCVRDISIVSEGRQARFSAELAQPNGEVIPAYLLDSAWRVGAMYAEQAGEELFVPVSIGRITLPLAGSGSDPLSDWDIRTTAPRVEDGVACWDRTEAYDASGVLGLVVENALASPLR